MLDALSPTGLFGRLQSLGATSSDHAWIQGSVDDLADRVPKNCFGIQAAVLGILSLSDRSHDLSHDLARKTCTTLGAECAESIQLLPTWFQDLQVILDQCTSFLRMCWLKAILGAWCTSVRLHSDPSWPCIFGCAHAADE